MSSVDKVLPDEAQASPFVPGNLPEFVFDPTITSCAWFFFDALCCVDGWSVLSSLARQHGDTSVQIIAIDLHEPQVLTLHADSSPEQYRAVCGDELVGATVVRWCGGRGHWGIHGSRDIEIAVGGQVGDARWPRAADCEVLTIDSAMRLARLARASDDVRHQLLRTYDALSWDPALEDAQALSILVDLCREVLADRVDPVVAIRGLVDLLERVPKRVRRIAATDRLHQAWTRTHYILLDADRAQFGPLLLAQNDSNHERHSKEERSLVRQACEQILGAVGGSRP